jgi:hypothetical protein
MLSCFFFLPVTKPINYLGRAISDPAYWMKLG